MYITVYIGQQYYILLLLYILNTFVSTSVLINIYLNKCLIDFTFGYLVKNIKLKHLHTKLDYKNFY